MNKQEKIKFIKFLGQLLRLLDGVIIIPEGKK